MDTPHDCGNPRVHFLETKESQMPSPPDVFTPGKDLKKPSFPSQNHFKQSEKYMEKEKYGNYRYGFEISGFPCFPYFSYISNISKHQFQENHFLPSHLRKKNALDRLPPRHQNLTTYEYITNKREAVVEIPAEIFPLDISRKKREPTGKI